jgi:dTMP kinase
VTDLTSGGRGKFITLEGGEGAGKSTQARLLKTALEARGLAVVHTREPGGSPGAEDIRKLLVEGEPGRWSVLSETLLFIAARADHVEQTIEPALRKGAWVISDRFSDSTYVYQGVARGLGVDKVRALQHAALGDYAPDLTVILDLEPEEGLKRAQERSLGAENRFEKFDGGFHARLRSAFRDIAAKEPERCVLIDGARAADVVANDILRAVEARLRP